MTGVRRKPEALSGLLSGAVAYEDSMMTRSFRAKDEIIRELAEIRAGIKAVLAA